ncbi:RNA polymerase sigma factor SigZ [Vibrio sp. T187]|uniref:RNA polymerase sigma factor SigZ n=1 Tax=Vibrio TaxID=662 RepID=UPI0010C98A7F|nr:MULTISPECIES: RNA polymerase sigma factor SigZ [Vibrio]MBW3698275.1 RNA polymerase sigma factor SigZ [Vibrio sp. T187]
MKTANNELHFEDIWSEYQKAIKAFLYSKVSNQDDVDDLQQEILIKTYQNLGAVKDSESVKSWLFQLANHTIIDFYRKRARHQRDNELQADELWFESNESDIEHDLAQCIRPFINALPAQQAELLEAVDLNKQSQKEIAAKNGVSYSTLKSQVQKSRTELKKLFEGCCHLSLDKHGNVIDYHAKSDRCSKC